MYFSFFLLISSVQINEIMVIMVKKIRKRFLDLEVLSVRSTSGISVEKRTLNTRISRKVGVLKFNYIFVMKIINSFSTRVT